MTEILLDVNAGILGLLALFAIIHPRIHTQIFGTIGLFLIFGSCLGLMDVWTNPTRLTDMMVLGNILTFAQFWWNSRHCKRAPCVWEEPPKKKNEQSGEKVIPIQPVN